MKNIFLPVDISLVWIQIGEKGVKEGGMHWRPTIIGFAK